MFDDCPCNTESVEGARSSSDLVKDQETLTRCIAENICHLSHFNHEGTLSACEVIRCPYSCKNTIHKTDIRRRSRNERANLRHQNNQRCLTHIGGFSRHIRTGNNRNPFLPVIEIRVICNKHIIRNHLLNHRMAAIFNIDHTFFIDMWAHIIILFCHKCKRCQCIDLRHRSCCFLNSDYFVRDSISHFAVNLILQCIQLILGSQNCIFQFL